MNKKDIKLKDCLYFFPLRVAITDYCNLRCFFCSNEGMPLSHKNRVHINIDELRYLIKILSDKSLNNISITGGDPTIHPKIFEIIDIFNQFNFKNLFFHTNGINLNEELLKKLSLKFNKLAISVHSVDFKRWRKITKGTKFQFKKLFSNLKVLSTKKFKDRFLIELKYVPVKGYNDSEREIKNFLELCNKYRFKFKLLNFEPILPSQIKLEMPFKIIKKKLFNIGCQAERDEKEFRGQSKYLPIKKFRYKNTFGVAIEIGCGKPKACKECYRSNEIFITPQLQVKPCHMSNYQIDIRDFIKTKNKRAIFKAIIDSRLYLARSPGAGLRVWQNNKFIQ